jgi:superfamily II DNA helicase RecQ
MKCIVCNIDFQSNYKHAKTCSKECSSILRKLNHDVWIDTNREAHNANKRKYHHEKDKDKHRERTRRYKKSEQGRKVRNAQKKRRLERDPLYRAKRNLRKRLWSYKQKVGTMSMSKSIGCSWEEFKVYIENKFYHNPETGEVMSWNNYGRGGWEMDHIIPLCIAANVEDLVKLSHYTNLQPLWHEDNNKKSIEETKLKSEIIKI